MHGHAGYNAFKETIPRCMFTVVFTDVGTWSYASGSVVHVDVDKLALCMDMQGTMHLKKQLTDACSQ